MAADLEIICVGNELLIGKIQDTNAHFICTQATHLGINVNRITVIQDIVEEIAKTLNEALARKPQFIITTGGLGPTFDDKTLAGIALGLNRKIVISPQALEIVKRKLAEYAKKRNLPKIELTEPRLKMAKLPENSIALNNPCGSAPGVLIELGETRLFVLPGVPAEAEAIFEETLKPILKQVAGKIAFFERSVFVENIHEGILAPLIDIVMSANKGVYIKSHPKTLPFAELHLTINESIENHPTEKLEKAVMELTELILENGGKIVTAEH